MCQIADFVCLTPCKSSDGHAYSPPNIIFKHSWIFYLLALHTIFKKINSIINRSAEWWKERQVRGRFFVWILKNKRILIESTVKSELVSYLLIQVQANGLNEATKLLAWQSCVLLCHRCVYARRRWRLILSWLIYLRISLMNYAAYTWFSLI